MARKSRSRVTGDDAPKTKKAQAKQSRAEHLTSDQFFEFIDRVGAHQTEAETAGMELAAVYKDTDKLGIHRQAAKLFKRLDSKEEAQRNDLLRSLFRYIIWAITNDRWEGLSDMIDQVQQLADGKQPSRASAREEEPAEPREPTEARAEGNGAARAPAEGAAAAPEADWDPGDGRPAEEVNQDLDSAGFTFAAGRAAGQRGEQPEDNPHGPHMTSHKVWERGRLQGAGERAPTDDADEGHTNGNGHAAAAAEEPAPAAPPKRKRATANGPAVVH